MPGDVIMSQVNVPIKMLSRAPYHELDNCPSLKQCALMYTCPFLTLPRIWTAFIGLRLFGHTFDSICHINMNILISAITLIYSRWNHDRLKSPVLIHFSTGQSDKHVCYLSYHISFQAKLIINHNVKVKFPLVYKKGYYIFWEQNQNKICLLWKPWSFQDINARHSGFETMPCDAAWWKGFKCKDLQSLK